MRALGMEPTCIVDIYTVSLEAQDLWLTATDGLFGLVSKMRMEELLTQHMPNLQQAAQALVDEANGNGGRDNITVVLAYVHEL